MKTNVSIDLSDEQRRALALLLGGKGLATRKQIAEFATATVLQKLAHPNGEKSELRNFICPKCSKPIALSVPGVHGNPGGAARPARSAFGEKMDNVVAFVDGTADALGLEVDVNVVLRNSVGAAKTRRAS